MDNSAFSMSIRPESSDDQLMSEFRTEEATTRRSRRRRYGRYAGVILTAVVAMGLAAVALPGAARSDGSLRVESEPGGAEVRIDGELRGKTPLMLALAPGDYTVGVGSREQRLTLAAGERASVYHIVSSSSAAAGAVAARAAALSVATQPAGGSVIIDGTDRGIAPVVVGDLAPGEHELIVRSRGRTIRRTLTLEAGVTSNILIDAAAPLTSAGWLQVQGPFTVQIREGGRLLGTSDTEALMLPSGDHQLAFSDEASGFRETRMVRIPAGETATVTLQVPRVAVNVNALPWAEVWIDNERVGETPIGNHLVTIGTHQVELRHPQLGTRRVSMAVSLTGTNRLSVNMRER